MPAPDDVMERLSALRCPEGSQPQIDLEADQACCMTLTGERVAELPSQAGLGVVGWAALVSGGIVLSALVLSWGR